MSDVRNVIIIGSGPAGYTAALYTARASLKPLVFEGAVTAGGALMNTTEVENFPGFKDGSWARTDGRDAGPGRAVRRRAGPGRHRRRGPQRGDQDGHRHRRHRPPGQGDHRGHRSQHRKLGLPNEDELSGRGVSYCATCDGFFFREQNIAVIGGGDTALEEATFLSRFASTVTVVHRRDTLRASKAMQERAFADPKITFLWDSEVAEIQATASSPG